MKTFIKTLFCAMLLPAACLDTADALNIDSIRADMAVPESPAFIIMDVNQSAIMRPSNAREIAVSIGNFIIGGATLPKTLGFELSPGMVLMKKSLSAYQDNAWCRFWYRTNVSGGINRWDNGSTDIAFGTRITVLDETDLVADKGYIKALTSVGFQHNAELVDFIKNNIPADYIFLNSDDTLRKKYEPLIKNAIAFYAVKYDSIIKETRDSVKQSKWNRSIMEVGLAGMGSSPDSITKHLVATKYGLWATYGGGLGEHNLNLVGLRMLLAKNNGETFKEVNGTVAWRSYYGENRYKGYLEGDGSYFTNDIPSYTVSLGGEMNLANGIWLEAMVGVRKQGDNDTKIVSTCNVKLATQEAK